MRKKGGPEFECLWFLPMSRVLIQGYNNLLSNLRTIGLSDYWTFGPSDYWTFGLLDLRNFVPLDYRTFGLLDLLPIGPSPN
jgi:hypothetical protein